MVRQKGYKLDRLYRISLSSPFPSMFCFSPVLLCLRDEEPILCSLGLVFAGSAYGYIMVVSSYFLLLFSGYDVEAAEIDLENGCVFCATDSSEHPSLSSAASWKIVIMPVYAIHSFSLEFVENRNWLCGYQSVALRANAIVFSTREFHLSAVS